MPILTAFAGELDALADQAARIPLASRDPEAIYVAVDELRYALTALSSRMRAGRPPAPANDRGSWSGPSVVMVTGYSQVLCAPGRKLRP